MTKLKLPPKKQHARHFRQVENIIVKNRAIEVPLGKRTILSLIGWESDDTPHVHSYKIIEGSLTRNKLMELVLGEGYPCWNNEYLQDYIIQKIEQSQAYKKIDKEIKTLCQEADDWGKKYKDYNWEKEVLGKIMPF